MISIFKMMRSSSNKKINKQDYRIILTPCKILKRWKVHTGSQPQTDNWANQSDKTALGATASLIALKEKLDSQLSNTEEAEPGVKKSEASASTASLLNTIEANQAASKQDDEVEQKAPVSRVSPTSDSGQTESQ